MAQVTSGYVDLGDGRLYYEMAGEGKTLVLAHAGFVDRRMWDDQWADFTQHYRVIRYDLRGFGNADPVSAPIAHRHDFYRLLQQLDVQRAALLGCSLGGEMILDFALEHAEMVSALIVVSTTPGGFELQGESPRHLLEMMAAIDQGDQALASELQNRLWIDGPFRQPDQVSPHVRRRAADMSRNALAKGAWVANAPQPLDPLAPPAVQRLDTLAMPALVVAGALDHPEILRAAEMMAVTLPNATKAILPDCAHLPNMEKSQAFNHIVLDFLQGVE